MNKNGRTQIITGGKARLTSKGNNWTPGGGWGVRNGKMCMRRHCHLEECSVKF